MTKQKTIPLLLLLVGGICTARGQTIIDAIASGGSNVNNVTINGTGYNVNSTIGQPVIDASAPNDDYTVGFNQGFTCQYVWDSVWVPVYIDTTKLPLNDSVIGWYELVPNTGGLYMQIKSGWCFTGVEETGDKQAFEANLFPNPATDQVLLRLTKTKNSETITWNLADVNGRNINTSKLNAAEVSIPLDGVSPGIYFLTVQCNSYSKSFKLIKN